MLPQSAPPNEVPVDVAHPFPSCLPSPSWERPRRKRLRTSAQPMRTRKENSVSGGPGDHGGGPNAGVACTREWGSETNFATNKVCDCEQVNGPPRAHPVSLFLALRLSSPTLGRVFQPHEAKQMPLPPDYTAPGSPLIKHLNMGQSHCRVLANRVLAKFNNWLSLGGQGGVCRYIK